MAATSSAPTSKFNAIIEHVIVHYRWVFVCFFLLPVSFVYDIFYYLRSWIVFQLASAPNSHKKKVSDVQTQVSFGLIHKHMLI